MSHPEIVDNCKKITVEYLIDAIGRGNIESIILYGSVARNEESYKYVNGKPYLESDLDVLVVVKNNAIIFKSWIRLRRLTDDLSDELRKKWLLSHVNLSVTTEKRLLDKRPNSFHLHLKLSGKVIFGKELIGLMYNYGDDRYKEIPIAHLTGIIFGYMIFVVRDIASSGILDGNITIDCYNSILKSIRKLTLFLLRVIIIKESLPVNQHDLTEIRAKRDLYQTKSSICNDLLNSYDEIKLCDSKEKCSMAELQKYLVRVIGQFNSTVTILTGINLPFVSLPKKLTIGQFPFIRRLEYSIYIFLINLETNLSIDLVKFLIIILRDSESESIYIRYYYLFASSSNLINTTDNENQSDIFQQRQSWQKLYSKSLKPWKYDVAMG
jgi:predicted nucleotidyltransferase